jgi:valyl-tRNA synthetase
VGILLSSAAGNDLLFDEDLMLQGRNFATKIWNAFRLTQGWNRENKPIGEAEKQTIEWFRNQLDKTILEIDAQFKQFRISDALHLIYKLIWDDFCAWYLEAVKPNYGEGISEEVYQETMKFFEELLKLLHPFMPFLTEELWQKIYQPYEGGETLHLTAYPDVDSARDTDVSEMQTALDILKTVRGLRTERKVGNGAKLETLTIPSDTPDALHGVIKSAARANEIVLGDAVDFVVAEMNEVK